MQRDSDSDANPSGAQEEDQMLKAGEGKKPKKKKSKPPVIVPANGGNGGRVSVVTPPGQVKKNQESEAKTTSDNSSLSTTTAAITTPNPVPPSSSNDTAPKEENFSNARKRKQTPAPFRSAAASQGSPKPPAWSRVFHVTPSVSGKDQPQEHTSSPTMERYLNDQFRQWTAQSEAGDTVHFPYLPPMQKTWSPAQAGPPPPLTTFTLHEGKVQNSRTLPDMSDSRWTRSGGMMSDEENEEQSPLNPLRRIAYSKRSAESDKLEKKRRVVEKDGEPNVQYKNVSERRRRYISDFYTTLVDASWPGTLLLFALSFFVSWLFFATLYYIICYNHGDFEPDHLPANQSVSGWKPCIWEIDDFSSCYLYSLETQHTIGYGSRQTTNLCISAMVTMSFQSIVGCLIQAFMVGLVFAKLSRPKQRSRTVVFSKQAVICERNKKLCMIFRVGDMRQDSFIVNAQISVKLIRRKVTEEGEMYHDVEMIKILPDSSNEPCVFLIWPITLVHEIDEDSPFFRHSATDLMRDKFELHVALEGTIESTSMNFQARTSYMPHEILWGHRFEPMMLYRRDHNKYQINFSAFHSTYEVDTPLCSAYELGQYYKARDKLQRSINNTSAPNTLPSQAKKSTSLAPTSGGNPPPLPRSLPPALQPTPQYNFVVESEGSTSGSSSSGSSDSKSEENSDSKARQLNIV